MEQASYHQQSKTSPQIKVCGLTRLDQAQACADLGVDAIGLVFYPKSPRHLEPEAARTICRGLPDRVKTVGVFVNEDYDAIMALVNTCGLSAVQLHGQERPALIARLRDKNLIVIKGLYIHKAPSLDEADRYGASAYLIESGHGKLPGGNAEAWDWQRSKDFGERYPLLLAGGLSPDNVAAAIQGSCPDAVDVSSGVEQCPGDKDLNKVKAFIEAVQGCPTLPGGPLKQNYRRIF
jgi:phosphoribosylanthranilate isomerase